MLRCGIALALPLIVLAFGCTRFDRAPTGDEVVWRLVDWPSVEASPAPPMGPHPEAVELGPAPFAVRGPARAIINGDQRYTFARPDLVFIFHNDKFVVPSTETFPLDIGLPAGLRHCDALTAEVTMSSLDESTVERVVGRCAGPSGAEHIQLAVPSPRPLHGRPIDLWIHARPQSLQGTRQRRFTIPEVPEGARLEFAYGIESDGWAPDASAATFHILIEDKPRPLFSTRLDPALNQSQRRWFNGSVDLSDYAGKRLPLVFQTSLDRSSDRRPFSDPVWGNPKVLARRRPAGRSPLNVLLISIDTLRARSVGAYGYTRPTTPFFDAFARDAVLFRQAVAASTSTAQSHMSLFTSLYPSAHGVTDMKYRSNSVGYRTLAEILRENGYVTAAFVETGLPPFLGFERGFDRYVERAGAPNASPEIERTFDAARQWMTDHDDEPFFVFIHTHQVHHPYTPPEQYRGILGSSADADSSAGLMSYEEEVRYTDDQLAKLWDSVKRLGLADRTLVVITADHGEEFGEHGALRHGSQLFDETLLVPLLMRAPGNLPSGIHTDLQVSLLDVLPTMLDVLDIPIPFHIQGRSVASLFRDDKSEQSRLTRELADRAVYAEARGATRIAANGDSRDWKPPAYARRISLLKVIYEPSTSALSAFALADDPFERNALANMEAPGVAAARDELLLYARTASHPESGPKDAVPTQPDEDIRQHPAERAVR